MQLKPWMLHMLIGAAAGALLFWLFEKLAFVILGVGAVGPVTTFAKEKIKRAKNISENADEVLKDFDQQEKEEIKSRSEIDNRILIESKDAASKSKVDWDSQSTSEPPTTLDVQHALFYNTSITSSRMSGCSS